MVMDESLPTNKQLTEIRELAKRAKKHGASQEEIYTALHQKPKGRREK